MRPRRNLQSCSDDRGNVALLFSLALPILVGFTGLGAEAGYWFYEQRRLQAAADLAAYAGAVVARAGGQEADILSASEVEASLHGFNPNIGTIRVNWPPSTGASINLRSVEVVLRQPYPRAFSALFLNDDVQVNVRAVARYDEPAPACILSLHRTQQEALLFSGSANARFRGCDLMSNSIADDAVTIEGSVEVRASCVNSSGGLLNEATLILDGCPEPRLYMPAAPDPYKDVPAPPDPGACMEPPPGGPGGKLVAAGKYCGGLHLTGNVTLEPGEYIVSGGKLQINANSNVFGDGVIFYLTDGAEVVMNGTAHIELSAQVSGPYQGMLFYADPDSLGSSALFNGTANSKLLGALYFPTQHVAMRGDFSGSGGCTRIVGYTVEIRGNPDFGVNCAGTGINDPEVPGAVRLIE